MDSNMEQFESEKDRFLKQKIKNEKVVWRPGKFEENDDAEVMKKIDNLGADKFLDRLLVFFDHDVDEKKNEKKLHCNPFSLEENCNKDETTITQASDDEYNPWREATLWKKISGKSIDQYFYYH